MKKMEYFICAGKSIETLEGQVKSLILVGWVPQGGIAVDNVQGIIGYYQAMIKFSEI